ncbi:dTDP-glucose 4,6-dehydratase [Abditibacterium utsteinense]|uniref:dTDP-glucose 4,6-dehydratase n=1 Tax=Abditibacterium utsteinense TaxID=1960156 RepID=A0A2S8STU8_9BACT|nr:dTDP-glucose 4,6-dehydratase [Abditibacterium utsteinense]PQV64233.1 dTDP-glucose 4,6-dehydratase [Abditibacterium utsteinense]
MKILVTGGAGFIGSNFVRLVAKERPNYQVVVIDKLTYAGRMENLEGLNCEFVEGDICDPKVVSKAMDGCEMVFNFAAESHVDRSLMGDPELAGAFVQTDVYGVYVLCEEAKKRGVSRFIQVSTDEVYGDVHEGYSVETDPLQPRSPYSASKAGGEMIATSYFISHGLPVIISRGSNTFGPYQFPEKLIPLMITNAIDDQKLPIYGDGLQRRDWIYALDHALGILIAGEKGTPGEAYNVGGGNERFNKEVVMAILEKLGKGEELIRYVEDRAGHDRRYALNFQKIKDLGYAPRYTFESALDETVKWFQNREDWWRAIRDGADYKDFYARQYDKRLQNA